jgi:hypothetical protein
LRTKTNEKLKFQFIFIMFTIFQERFQHFNKEILII